MRYILAAVVFLLAASVHACNYGVSYAGAYGYMPATAYYQPIPAFNYQTMAMPSMLQLAAPQAASQTTTTTTTTVTTPALLAADPGVQVTTYQSPTVTSLYSYSAYPTGYTYQPYSLFGNFGYGLYGANYGGYGGYGRTVGQFRGFNYR